MSERERAIQECISKMAVMETLARYSNCVDSGDAPGFAAVFTEDAVWQWEAIGLTYTGRNQLRTLAEGIARHLPGAQHMVSNPIVTIDGDHAHCVSQVITFLSRPENIYTVLQGFYEDTLRKVGDSWLIAHRRVRVANPEIISQGKIGEYYKPLVEFLSQAAS